MTGPVRRRADDVLHKEQLQLLEDTLAALRHDRYPVDVPEPTRTDARRSIERMLAIG